MVITYHLIETNDEMPWWIILITWHLVECSTTIPQGSLIRDSGKSQYFSANQQFTISIIVLRSNLNPLDLKSFRPAISTRHFYHINC